MDNDAESERFGEYSMMLLGLTCLPHFEHLGGSVHGERTHFTTLVLGCIEADFCKYILVHIFSIFQDLQDLQDLQSVAPFESNRKPLRIQKFSKHVRILQIFFKI